MILKRPGLCRKVAEAIGSEDLVRKVNQGCLNVLAAAERLDKNRMSMTWNVVMYDKGKTLVAGRGQYCIFVLLEADKRQKVFGKFYKLLRIH